MHISQEIGGHNAASRDEVKGNGQSGGTQSGSHEVEDRRRGCGCGSQAVPMETLSRVRVKGGHVQTCECLSGDLFLRECLKDVFLKIKYMILKKKIYVPKSIMNK